MLSKKIFSMILASSLAVISSNALAASSLERKAFKALLAHPADLKIEVFGGSKISANSLIAAHLIDSKFEGITCDRTSSNAAVCTLHFFYDDQDAYDGNSSETTRGVKFKVQINADGNVKVDAQSLRDFVIAG